MRTNEFHDNSIRPIDNIGLSQHGRLPHGRVHHIGSRSYLF